MIVYWPFVLVFPDMSTLFINAKGPRGEMRERRGVKWKGSVREMMDSGGEERTYQVDVFVFQPNHFTRYSNILEVPSGPLPTALRLEISHAIYTQRPPLARDIQRIGVDWDTERDVPDILFNKVFI